MKRKHAVNATRSERMTNKMRGHCGGSVVVGKRFTGGMHDRAALRKSAAQVLHRKAKVMLIINKEACVACGIMQYRQSVRHNKQKLTKI